jgi:hypothetical protein
VNFQRVRSSFSNSTGPICINIPCTAALGMPVVSITRLRMRSWRFLPGFFVYAIRSSREVARAEGNLGIQLLRDRRNTFWTATLWDSEEDMKRFMIAGVHGRAMRKLMHWQRTKTA